MTDINEPITVEPPTPITVLESALIALEHNSSKSVHLSVRQAETILIHIKKQAKTIIDLADKLSAYEVVAHPIIAIWDNEKDEVYNE